MLVDSHCHLTDERFEKRTDEVVEEAKKEGVEKIMTASESVEDSMKVIALVKRFEEIEGVVGVHPGTIGKKNFKIEEEVEKLEKLIEKERDFIKGIGEIGLDFYYDKEKKSKEIQIRLFKEQLRLAEKWKLPVVIHMREAEEDMMEVLEEFGESGGMFHCWSGSEKLLRLVLSRGFYVSVAGNVTFRNAKELRRLVKLVPNERLLLETDSPNLSPEPVRGRLNEPKNVKILAKFVAELRGVETQDLIKQTRKNYLCLFG